MEIVKARCHFSLRFDMGHNFLSSSLICRLFTNLLLGKNTQFKCKCNLRRGAASRFAVSIANTHLQREKSAEAESSSCQSQVESFTTSALSLKPPAAEPQPGEGVTAAKPSGIPSWVHHSSMEAGGAWVSMSKAHCHHLWKPEVTNFSQQVSILSGSRAGVMLGLSQGRGKETK